MWIGAITITLWLAKLILFSFVLLLNLNRHMTHDIGDLFVSMCILFLNRFSHTFPYVSFLTQENHAYHMSSARNQTNTHKQFGNPKTTPTECPSNTYFEIDEIIIIFIISDQAINGSQISPSIDTCPLWIGAITITFWLAAILILISVVLLLNWIGIWLMTLDACLWVCMCILFLYRFTHNFSHVSLITLENHACHMCCSQPNKHFIQKLIFCSQYTISWHFLHKKWHKL